MINLVDKICKYCGKEYQCQFFDKDRSKFCSKHCVGKGTKKRSNSIIVYCGFCKKEMKLPISRFKQNKLGVVYCSQRCKSNALKSGKAGYGFKSIN